MFVFFLIRTVTMVVQTCRVVFWNQHVKLQLTPRSKGQVDKNMLILGEKGQRK